MAIPYVTFPYRVSAHGSRGGVVVQLISCSTAMGEAEGRRTRGAHSGTPQRLSCTASHTAAQLSTRNCSGAWRHAPRGPCEISATIATNAATPTVSIKAVRVRDRGDVTYHSDAPVSAKTKDGRSACGLKSTTYSRIEQRKRRRRGVSHQSRIKSGATSRTRPAASGRACPRAH